MEFAWSSWRGDCEPARKQGGTKRECHHDWEKDTQQWVIIPSEAVVCGMDTAAGAKWIRPLGSSWVPRTRPRSETGARERIATSVGEPESLKLSFPE